MHISDKIDHSLKLMAVISESKGRDMLSVKYTFTHVRMSVSLCAPSLDLSLACGQLHVIGID